MHHIQLNVVVVLENNRLKYIAISQRRLFCKFNTCIKRRKVNAVAVLFWVNQNASYSYKADLATIHNSIFFYATDSYKPVEF